MVINMDESKLRTIAQLEEFLTATPEVCFSGVAVRADSERYEHISRVLRRFDYPHRTKRERGVVLAYLQRTSGYSRAQIKRLVSRFHANHLASVPLVNRYRAPALPFARKYTANDIELLSVITKFSGLMFTFSDGQGGKDLQQNGTGIATGAVLNMSA